VEQWERDQWINSKESPHARLDILERDP